MTPEMMAIAATIMHTVKVSKMLRAITVPSGGGGHVTLYIHGVTVGS